jgi:hypothetical protein
MGLAFVGGLAGSDKSADLSRPPEGDGATGGQGDQEKFFCRLVPPSPCLSLLLSPSLLSHAHCGLWALRDLSHRKSLRQVFDQIINIFDADREAH